MCLKELCDELGPTVPQLSIISVSGSSGPSFQLVVIVIACSYKSIICPGTTAEMFLFLNSGFSLSGLP